MAITNALEGRPWYWGLGIGLALALAIVAGVHYFFVSKINADIAASQVQLDELSKKIEAGRTAQKKLPQFREEVARLELELDKLRRILPSTRNTEEIIKKIKSLVDQGDFTLRSLVFPKLDTSAAADIYAQWPISVSVEGGYHNLAILFNRLGNFSRIINVEKFSISAMQGSEHTITSDFVAKTFVYVEPKEAPPPEKGKPGPKKKEE
jgi:type IV pilus assembly protein PilO